MKIQLDSVDVRRMIAEHVIAGTCSEFALAIDTIRQRLMCVRSGAVTAPYALALSLEDMCTPPRLLEGASEDEALEWLSQRCIWAEIAQAIEHNVVMHDYRVHWVDLQHYRILSRTGLNAMQRTPSGRPLSGEKRLSCQAGV